MEGTWSPQAAKKGKKRGGVIPRSKMKLACKIAFPFFWAKGGKKNQFSGEKGEGTGNMGDQPRYVASYTGKKEEKETIGKIAPGKKGEGIRSP